MFLTLPKVFHNSNNHEKCEKLKFELAVLPREAACAGFGSEMWRRHKGGRMEGKEGSREERMEHQTMLVARKVVGAGEERRGAGGEMEELGPLE